MGAWGEGPFANDGALDWLGSEIQDPIAGVIKKTLEHFLARKKKMLRVSVYEPPPKGAPRKMKNGRLVRQGTSKIVKMMGRHREHDVAEAAAGLLDEFTPYGKRRAPVAPLAKRRKWNPKGLLSLGSPRAKLPVHIHLHYMAEELHLYTLAMTAIVEIFNDEAYMSSWTDRAAKRSALYSLVRSLESKIQYERDKKALSSRMRSYRARMKKKGVTLRKPRRKLAFG